MARSVPGKVFISYSHDDAQWLELLQTMLKPLVRAGGILLWDDTRVRTGARWRQDIHKALDSATVGVMLVSPRFLASDFISQVELPGILGAASRRGLTVCWVLLSECLYETSGLLEFQAVHDIRRPLDSLYQADLNATLANIAREIGRLAAGDTLPINSGLPCPPPVARQDEVVVVHGTKVFRRGGRVRIRLWAGLMKPEDTGLTFSVHADAGRSGTVAGGSGSIVRVMWDPQEWNAAKFLFFKGAKVTLDSFEATMNADWLEVVR